MKSLTCEMCGSNNLIKQEGVFVCQSCGTKYSVEEAKKLIIEGTVDVTGTVKVDDADELKNLYVLARRAKDDNNRENAQKYYEQILVKDPSSWEASFYSVYYQTMNCTIAEIGNAAIRLTNCENSVLKLIKDNIPDKREQKAVVKEVADKLIYISNMLGNSAFNHISNYNDMLASCTFTMCIPLQFGDYVYNQFGDDYSDIFVDCWEKGIDQNAGILEQLLKKHNKETENVIKEYVTKIHRYDPNFVCRAKPPKETPLSSYIVGFSVIIFLFILYFYIKNR